MPKQKKDAANAGSQKCSPEKAVNVQEDPGLEVKIVYNVIDADGVPDFSAHFLQKEFVIYGNASENEMTRALYVLSSTSIGCKFNPGRSHIRRLLNPLNKPSQKGVKMLLRVLCSHPEELLAPALKVLNQIIRFESINRILCWGSNGQILIKTLSLLTHKSNLEENKVLSFGALSNMILHPTGRELFNNYRYMIDLNLIYIAQENLSDELQIALATFYWNLSICYGEKFERNRIVTQTNYLYKIICETLLPYITNGEAAYKAIIAVGSFMTFGQRKTLEDSTFDFLFAQLSRTEEKLVNACHSLLAHMLED